MKKACRIKSRTRGEKGTGRPGGARDKKKEVDLMKRKWLSALLSGALAAALTAAPVSAASVFTGETVDEWAVERVESAIRLELMPECLEGQDLRAEMTRAEFAALTVKLYGGYEREAGGGAEAESLPGHPGPGGAEGLWAGVRDRG